jgi:hypothetical protein
MVRSQSISMMDTLLYFKMKTAIYFFQSHNHCLSFISLSKGSHLLIVSGKALSSLFISVSAISLFSYAELIKKILLQKSTILFLH